MLLKNILQYYYVSNNKINCTNFKIIRKYDSKSFRKSVKKLLFFFYKQVHPDLTTNLPNDLKNINNESLSFLNSYIDILSSNKNESKITETNIFLKKKLIFFKAYENNQNKIIENRYKNIIINLPTISNDLSLEERENITAKLIYEIEKALEKTNEKKIIFENENNIENIEKLINNEKKNVIDELWNDITDDVKDTEALFQPSEKEIQLKKKKRLYFNYIKSKLEKKFQRIHHKKRRQQKLKNIDNLVNTIVDQKYSHIPINKYNKILIDQSYKIIQNGYNPNLIFFHKDLKEEEKKKAIDNLCGINLKNDADKWLLESCLKILKNHKIPLPIIIHSEQIFKVSDLFGTLYIPFNFKLNDFFDFLEKNIDKARQIKKKVMDNF